MDKKSPHNGNNREVLLDINGDVAIATINRPHRRNAMDMEVRHQLYQTLKKIDSRDDIRVVVITGTGNTFVAGADISSMKDYSLQDAQRAAEQGNRLLAFVENMHLPVIAAVNGWALGGGCELAMACDIRICTDDARFGQPETRLGIIPGYGANVRLPRLVGIGRAKEMIFTGRIIDADEAVRIGLVNKVVPRDELMTHVMDLASKISGAKLAVAFAKRALNQSFDLTTAEGVKLASKLYEKLYNTHDRIEGISAYLEKRDPVFTGN